LFNYHLIFQVLTVIQVLRRGPETGGDYLILSDLPILWAQVIEKGQALLSTLGVDIVSGSFPAQYEREGASETFPGFRSLEPVAQWTNSQTQTTAVRNMAAKRRNTYISFSVQINFRLGGVGGEAVVVKTEATGVSSGY
jgi:hypothetical protein